MKRELFKKSALLILATIICLSFCSCSSSKTELKFGTWEGNTFKNESTNLTFTIDDTSTIVSPEKMKKFSNHSSSFNGLDKKPNKNDDLIFDSAVSLKDQVSSIHLIYINLSDLENHAGEKNYLERLIKEFEDYYQQKIDIKLNKYGDANIAGDDYKTAELEISAHGVSISLKFYLRIENGFAIEFITTSPTDDTSLRDEFMTRIQHIK